MLLIFIIHRHIFSLFRMLPYQLLGTTTQKHDKCSVLFGQGISRMLVMYFNVRLLRISNRDMYLITECSVIAFFAFSGCWEVSGKQDCHQNACVANKKPPKALNNTKFCCCNGDLCNMNVSDVYVASQADDPCIESPGKNCVWIWLRV